MAKLADDALVDYIVGARREKDPDAAVEAARILAWRYEPRIRAFVFKEIGDMGQAVCDEVAERCLVSAISSADKFEGATPQEFGGWIFTIARRRIIDLHRERRRRVDEEPTERKRGDGEWEEREFPSGDVYQAVDRGSVFNQALYELNDAHKLVVFMLRFRDLSHRKIAEQINRHFGDALNDPMTEQNVNQINSRFGKRLDELLEEADDPPRPDDDDG